MENIQFDAFNPEPYMNHVSEIKNAVNKKNMQLIIIVGGVFILGLIAYRLIDQYLEEKENQEKKTINY